MNGGCAAALRSQAALKMAAGWERPVIELTTALVRIYCNFGSGSETKEQKWNKP